MESKKRCYIAGPISGLDPEVYLANFNEAKQLVADIGFEPVCPTDLPHIHDKSWLSHMREDLAALLTCDCIFLMRGWQGSRGARIEARLAAGLGLFPLYQDVIDDAERVSATPEMARKYLESLGYDVDALQERGIKKIKALIQKHSV